MHICPDRLQEIKMRLNLGTIAVSRSKKVRFLLEIERLMQSQRIGVLLLLIAHLALLGLQSYYKYYQFSNFPAVKTVQYAKSAAIHAQLPSLPEGRQEFRRMLLDKRFASGPIFYFSFPFFSLPITVNAPKGILYCKRIHARVTSHTYCLRGPPDGLPI